MHRSQSLTRVMSPVALLVAAALFLLPFMTVSLDTNAVQGALGSALQQLGGGSGGGSPCLQALNRGDLISHTGFTLALGRPPSITQPPSCATASDPGPIADSAAVGVQPVLTAVLVLLVIGVAAALLRVRPRALVAGAAAAVAAILVAIASITVHGAVLTRTTRSVNDALAGLGLGNGDAFVKVHPGIGFWLILLTLLVAIAINAAALAGDAARGQRRG